MTRLTAKQRKVLEAKLGPKRVKEIKALSDRINSLSPEDQQHLWEYVRLMDAARKKIKGKLVKKWSRQ